MLDLVVPAAYGGRHETVDPVAICVVRETLMGVCSAADSLFALQGIGSYAITVAGTEEQRRTWLPKVATGEVLAALGAHRADGRLGPQGRHHPRGLGRTAGSTLNGHKSFISNAGVAGYYIVLAQEGELGLSAFLVPADSPGLTDRAEPRTRRAAPAR